MKTFLSLFILLFSVIGLIAEQTVGDQRVTEAMNDFVASQQAVSQERSVLSERLTKLKQQSDSLNKVLEEKRVHLDKQLAENRAVLEQQKSVQKSLSDLDEIIKTAGFDKSEEISAIFKKLSSEVETFATSERIEKTVFDKSGIGLQGEVLQFGATSYWLGEGGRAGAVVTKNGVAVLKEFSGENATSVKKLFSGEKVELPIYFDSQSAFLEEETGLLVHLKKGGAAIVPLLLLAVLCVVVAVVRSVALFGIVHSSDEKKIVAIAQKVSSGDKSTALELVTQLKRPLSDVIREGVEHAHLPKDSLEEILYERVTLEVPRLERWLAALAVGATAAPLLGLLGTVTGMISTFKQITVYGTGNAAVLSGGISEALITTEAGLIIAIPALIMHAWLARRVSKAVSLTQKGAIVFVNELKVK